MTSQRDLQRLSYGLGVALARVPVEARGVIKKGAQNIKDDARGRVSQHPSWRHIASSISYDVQGNAFYSRASIGYDRSGQGKLAGIYEFGSARRRPHPTLMPAFEAEKPRFVAEMDKAVKRALGGLP